MMLFYVASEKSQTLVCWLVCCLLAGPDLSGLVEEDAVEVFHYNGFHLSSSFLMHNFKSFQRKYEIVFPFPFHIFMPLANLWFIRLQGQFPILRTRSCLDLQPLIHLPGRPLGLGRGRILIPGFIRSPPTLAVQVVKTK